MSSSRRAVLSAGILALSGCTGFRPGGSGTTIAGPDRWPVVGRNPARRGRYGAGSIPAKAPDDDRTIELAGSTASSPVAAGDRVVVGDDRGLQMVALDPPGGSRRIGPAKRTAAAPSLDGETVYAATDARFGNDDRSSVFAVTFDDRVRWRTELPAEVVTSPLVDDGTVFVRTGDAYLAVDAASGAVHWRRTEAPTLSETGFLAVENLGPAVGDGVVVFPDGDGVTAVDPADGTVRWRRRVERVRAPPTVADGTVYAAGVGSGVHAFDAATGDPAWRWSATGCWAPPVVAGDRVYAAELADVVALSRSTGDLAWRMDGPGLGGTVQSGMTVVGETVLAGASGAGVTAVDSASGTERWSVGPASFNTPLAVGDRIAFVEYGPDTPSLRLLG